MTIDERLQALTMNLELAHREIADHWRLLQEHRRLIEIDAENIRALARIAEAHEHRLDQMS